MNAFPYYPVGGSPGATTAVRHCSEQCRTAVVHGREGQFTIASDAIVIRMVKLSRK